MGAVVVADSAQYWDAVVAKLDRKAPRIARPAGSSPLAPSRSGVEASWRLDGAPVDEFSLALVEEDRWWFEAKAGPSTFLDTVDRSPFGARMVVRLMDSLLRTGTGTGGEVEIDAESNLRVRSAELNWVMPAASSWKDGRLRRWQSGRPSAEDRVIEPSYPLDRRSAFTRAEEGELFGCRLVDATGREDTAFFRLDSWTRQEPGLLGYRYVAPEVLWTRPNPRVSSLDWAPLLTGCDTDDIVEALARQEICLSGERLRIDWLPEVEGSRLYDALPG